MTMQFDVNSAKIHGSGFLFVGRVRLKQATILGNGTAGYIDFFDTTTAPVAATYARSGTTVTVTSTAHGLSTGDFVGITYSAATGVSPVSGNFQITKTGADTFTLVDLNSGTIAGGTACRYVSDGDRWIGGTSTSTGPNPYQFLIPGEGYLCRKGIYASTSNITSTAVSYG